MITINFNGDASEIAVGNIVMNFNGPLPDMIVRAVTLHILNLSKQRKPVELPVEADIAIDSIAGLAPLDEEPIGGRETKIEPEPGRNDQPAPVLGKRPGGLQPDKWSPERVAAMVSIKGLGGGWPEVLEAVNAMPGEKIASAGACYAQYRKLENAGRLPKAVRPPPPAPKIETPVVKAPAPVQAVPAKPAVQVPQAVKVQPQPIISSAGKTRKPVRASAAEIEQWASVRGLCNGVDARLDMERINAKRDDLGLAPFELVKGR